MKKNLLFLLVLSLAFAASSCDDAGVTVDKKNIEFSQTNLKPLDKQVEGVYEAWVSLGGHDHGDDAYVSVGRFNISSTGQLVDTSGGSGSLHLNSIPDVNATEDAIITIEAPGDFDTIPGTKILGAAKTMEGGYVVFNMIMGYGEVLPVANQFSSSTAQYILASPTDRFAGYNIIHGLWFTLDTNGSSPGLTLPSLPDTAEWTYQAWITDNRDSTNRIYNMGRFTKPNDKDDNQQCENNPPAATWLVPGHDWIQPNCPGGGIPDIDNLNNSNFKLMITLEPKFETSGLSKPFYIRLFYGTVLGQFINPTSVPNSTALPTAQIRLSVTR